MCAKKQMCELVRYIYPCNTTWVRVRVRGNKTLIFAYGRSAIANMAFLNLSQSWQGRVSVQTTTTYHFLDIWYLKYLFQLLREPGPPLDPDGGKTGSTAEGTFRSRRTPFREGNTMM
jgi:hypothetical protein